MPEAHRTSGELGSALLRAGISLSPMFPGGACTQLWLTVSPSGHCLCSGRLALAEALDPFLRKYNRFQFLNVPIRSTALKEEEPPKSGHSAPCSPKANYMPGSPHASCHSLLTGSAHPSLSQQRRAGAPETTSHYRGLGVRHERWSPCSFIPGM